MDKSKWVWMPHAGHFICGNECRFVLNTYVGKYIVSTVGELWLCRISREVHANIHNRKWLQEHIHLKGDIFDHAYMKEFGYEQVGCDRKYETMVFRAEKSDNKCCPYRIIVDKNVDFKGYNESNKAYKGHYKLCNKWAWHVHRKVE